MKISNNVSVDLHKAVTKQKISSPIYGIINHQSKLNENTLIHFLNFFP